MAYAHPAAIIATPIGSIRIEAVDDLIASIRIGAPGDLCEPGAALLKIACEQLRAYFAGELNVFDLPLTPAKSERGPALRQAIRDIGFGRTLSYGEVAALSGSSARAIGQACARNPFPIVVPCHRVLVAGGELGPYSAGDGPTTKTWLLKHERAEAWLI